RARICPAAAPPRTQLPDEILGPWKRELLLTERSEETAGVSDVTHQDLSSFRRLSPRTQGTARAPAAGTWSTASRHGAGAPCARGHNRTRQAGSGSGDTPS